MKVVGLTGGIGSGKSTVAAMFEDLGIPVYYADPEAKKLMNFSAPIRTGIKNLFGKEAYEQGELNRAYIARVVFNDPKKLKALNELVHPAVKEHFLNWVKQQSSPYVIQENPLLFEKKSQDLYDFVITVTAKKDLRIKRVMERDGMTEPEVLDRMRNQMEDQAKISGADFVIHNETLEDTRKRVKEIHQHLLS